MVLLSLMLFNRLSFPVLYYVMPFLPAVHFWNLCSTFIIGHMPNKQHKSSGWKTGVISS